MAFGEDDESWMTALVQVMLECLVHLSLLAVRGLLYYSTIPNLKFSFIFKIFIDPSSEGLRIAYAKISHYIGVVLGHLFLLSDGFNFKKSKAELKYFRELFFILCKIMKP
jgi:hypothetical protein